MTGTQILLIVCGALAATIIFVAAPRVLDWLLRDNKSSLWPR
jgi:hypothetical protein